MESADYYIPIFQTILIQTLDHEEFIVDRPSNSLWLDPDGKAFINSLTTKVSHIHHKSRIKMCIPCAGENNKFLSRPKLFVAPVPQVRQDPQRRAC